MRALQPEHPPSSSARQIVSPAPSLLNLPEELTAKICQNFEDDKKALGAIRLTCRELHHKTMFSIRNVFFKTVKITLHPVSLGQLTSLSRGATAAHVQHIIIEPTKMPWIDPVHDAEMNMPAPLVHTKSDTQNLDKHELFKKRMSRDIDNLQDAIGKLSALKLILVGKNPELEGCDIKQLRARGLKDIREFSCPSGHCKDGVLLNEPELLQLCRAYLVADLALSHPILEGRNIGICLDLGRLPLDSPQSEPYWGPDSEPPPRAWLTNLQLHLGNERSFAHDFQALYSGCNIETLNITYERLHRYIPGTEGNHRLSLLPLDNLKSLTLQQGSFRPSNLCKLLQSRLGNLSQLCLVNCAIVSTPHPATGIESDPPVYNWKTIIMELSELQHLSYLRLENLQSERVVYPPSRPLKLWLDPALATKATWVTRDEVTRGLKYLLLTHGTVSSNIHKKNPITHNSNDGLKHYLNVRFANFKANSTVYPWTLKEAAALHLQRYHASFHYPYCPKLLEDPKEFHIPSVELGRVRSYSDIGPQHFIYAENTAGAEGGICAPVSERRVRMLNLSGCYDILSDTDGQWTTVWCRKGKVDDDSLLGYLGRFRDIDEPQMDFEPSEVSEV